MQVIELYELTVWIETEVIQKKILKKYKNLHAILNQNTQPNQEKQPFENQKEDLINTLAAVPLHSLNIDKLEFLKELSIYEAVGEDAINSIEDILYKNVIDPATSAAKVQEIINGLSSGIDKSNRVKEALQPFIVIEESKFDEVLVRVNFSGHAEINNVKDFKDWGNVWYEIGRGIARVNDKSPEEVKIIGAKRGSVIIEMAVLYGIAHTMSLIILSALKVTDRVYDIRKKAEELRGLKLSNKKLANELDKEADKEKEDGIENIVNQIIKESNMKKDGEGDKLNELNNAVKHLVEFTEKGGEIDFVIPEEEEEQEEAEATDKNKQEIVKRLRSSFEEIRLLEQKLKQIEYKEEK